MGGPCQLTVASTAQTTESSEVTADTPKFAPKPSTMLVESGASGHCLDDEFQSDPKNKHLNCKALERPHKILTAGPHVLPETATRTISGKIIGTDRNKRPVEHATWET